MLEYLLKVSGTEKRILQDVKRSGAPLPNSIANAPELREDLGLFWAAFWQLSNGRSTENGITFLEVATWAQIHHIAGDDFDDLLFLVKAMDGAFMAYQKARRADGNSSRDKRE